MNAFLFNPALWNGTSIAWLALLPAIGVAVLLRKDRQKGQTLWLVAAVILWLVAFVSPIGVLANGYLFSAHMVQHLLLLLGVPLCLLLSLPKEPLAKWLEQPRWSSFSWLLTMPLLGWIAGLGAMWLWHIPSLCSGAAQSDALGMVRTANFLVAGLLFWWPIYSPMSKFRLDPLTAVVYLFSACLGCTLLGIYITFTTISVCPAFASPVDRIGILTALYDVGLTPSTDQQLGGLLMWVPPCSLYVCAIVSVMCRWYQGECHSSDHPLPEVTDLPGASV